MPVEYTIKYRPGRHFVVPFESRGPAGVIPAFNVVDDESGRIVATSLIENDASSVCFALDILNAHISGDNAKLRELLKLAEALKKGTLQ